MNIYVNWISGHYSVVIGSTLIAVHTTKEQAIAQAQDICDEMYNAKLKVKLHICKM